MPKDFHTQQEVEAAFGEGAQEAQAELESPSILGGLNLGPLGLDSVEDARAAGCDQVIRGE
jgi:hypothetical protein